MKQIATIALVLAMTGCAPQNVVPTEPVTPIDISAIEGKWEGRSKRWGARNTLEVFTDEHGRAVAKYCWGGWCRTTRATYALKNPKITPTSVEFGLGKSRVTYRLDGDTLKGLFDSTINHWDHEIELKRM